MYSKQGSLIFNLIPILELESSKLSIFRWFARRENCKNEGVHAGFKCSTSRVPIDVLFFKFESIDIDIQNTLISI